MAVNTLAAGTSCLTKVEDLLIDVLSDKASLHAFLDVADKAAALAGNMYLDSAGLPDNGEEWTDEDWNALFPMVVIGAPGDEDGSLRFTRIASGGAAVASGVLMVDFVILADMSRSETEDFRHFKNAVVPILEDVASDDRIDLTEVTIQLYGGTEQENDTVSPKLIMRVSIPWGVGDA